MPTEAKQYKIGDRVWIARLKHREFTEKCPDCLGTLVVTLLLENGEREALECQRCTPGGYERPRGYIFKTQYQPSAEQQTISSMEIGPDKTTYRFYNCSCDEVFDNEVDAVKAAEKLRQESEDNDYQRFVWKKEDSRRSWAWNCSYYRKQIKRAEQDLAYAKARLTVCKVKAKEPEVPEAK